MNLGMLRLYRFILVIFFSITFLNASITSLDFDLIKKGQQDDNTLLIVGGIQGNEPGGFIAASLIATHYQVTKGSVWVVPNLNFYSIIQSSRGPNGDMNRKFANLSENDPEYDIIQRIKNYIVADEVKKVLNLHDGSGYYRKTYIDEYHNPRRWGQCSVIDQESLEHLDYYGNLYEIAQQVVDHLNQNLLRQEDVFDVKNTQTKFEETYEQTEMAKTLTYFAIKNGKSAFGHETSKNLPVHERVYYKLLALEEHMRIMGIEFQRSFDISPEKIEDIIENDIFITFYDDKVKLPLSQIRDIIRYFPVRKDGTLEFTPSNPLLTVINDGNTYTIHYGNRKLASIKPDYIDIEKELTNVKLQIDGEEIEVPLGSIVNVKKNFLVHPIEDIRTNVIGYTNKNFKNEVGVIISKEEIPNRFSVDKKGEVYRIEFYNESKFLGMIMVNFGEKNSSDVSLDTIMIKKEVKS